MYSKNRIYKLLENIDTKKKITKIRKAKNEKAFWLYGSIGLGLFISVADLKQSDIWLSEYLKCVLDYDFDYKIMEKSAKP